MKRSIRFHNVLFVLLLLAVSVALLPGTAQASMIMYLNFNEGTGTVANDFSANNNDGTFSPGGAYGPPSWTAGHTGNVGDFSVAFKGGTDYVGVPDSSSFDTITTAFTIALWAREDWGGEWQYLLYADGGGRQFYFQSDHGTPTAYVGSDTDHAWDEALGFNITDGSWHHYALTYSDSTLTSYKDGTLQNTYAVGATFPNFTDSLSIGGPHGGWTSFEGPIDDVVIFNTVENIGLIMDGTHPDMVPEPATLSLLVLGGLAMLRRRRAA